MDNRATLLEQVLRCLPDASDLDLFAVVQFFETGTQGITGICKREEAAKILGVSTKRIDQLSSEGKLERVYFDPEAQRASGYTRESVQRLAGQRGTKQQGGNHD